MARSVAQAVKSRAAASSTHKKVVVLHLDGTPMRGPEESPNREEALRMYSLNSVTLR